MPVNTINHCLAWSKSFDFQTRKLLKAMKFKKHPYTAHNRSQVGFVFAML